MQAKYMSLTNNTKLKVKWTESLGFFVEVPNSTPLDRSLFLPCQTLKSHLRYKTAELVELDNKRFGACEKVKKLEVRALLTRSHHSFLFSTSSKRS